MNGNVCPNCSSDMVWSGSIAQGKLVCSKCPVCPSCMDPASGQDCMAPMPPPPPAPKGLMPQAPGPAVKARKPKGPTQSADEAFQRYVEQAEDQDYVMVAPQKERGERTTRPRRSGKTTDLLLQAVEFARAMPDITVFYVVPGPQMRRYVLNMLNDNPDLFGKSIDNFYVMPVADHGARRSMRHRFQLFFDHSIIEAIGYTDRIMEWYK